jgi:hypothetical protein
MRPDYLGNPRSRHDILIKLLHLHLLRDGRAGVCVCVCVCVVVGCNSMLSKQKLMLCLNKLIQMAVNHESEISVLSPIIKIQTIFFLIKN